ncbi:MAG: toll/interleukin-1 receptor domain-containing protein, partial [Thermoanaerobaculia bacterium]|nr:toll/interleukin-1 receptor domain-containing protein [Thermoanaerobaculia bacterium]
MPAPLKTFIIYSSADRELRSALERQLKSLIDNGLIRLWSDKEILPGEMWDSTIKKQLLEAELFLMLISADFFNSNYIREEEFVTALQKLERGEAIIIPIIGRDCDWEAYAEIKKLQVLPPGGVAVTDLDHWKNTDKAWAEVTRAIRRRIEALPSEQIKREKTAPRHRP